MIALWDRMPIFAYKTNAFLMALKKQCSADIENIDVMKMLKSLSPYACAAKTLFSANTSAKNPNGVKQNQCKTSGKPYILMDSRGRLTEIDPTKFEAKRPRADPYSHGYRCQNTNT